MLVTLAIIALRFFWVRLPGKLRNFLVYSAAAVILLRIFFIVSKWTTTSDRTNAALNWGSVAGYELFLVLFTLLRPRWLTTISAAILLVPVFASSILMPLTGLFDSTPADITSIGNHLICDKNPWDAQGPTQSAGVDLTVFYRSTLVPFMRRKVQRASFSNEQCNTSAAFAAVEPDHKHLRFHCPEWPSQQNAGAVDLILPIK